MSRSWRSSVSDWWRPFSTPRPDADTSNSVATSPNRRAFLGPARAHLLRLLCRGLRRIQRHFRDGRPDPWRDSLVSAGTPQSPGLDHPLRSIAPSPSHLYQRQHGGPEGGGSQPRVLAGATRRPRQVHRSGARRSGPRHPADLRARQPGLGGNVGHTAVRSPASRLHRARPGAGSARASSRDPDGGLASAVRTAAAGGPRRRAGGKRER